jgi:hypothetical protein
MKKLTRIAALIASLVLIPVVPAFGYDFVPTGYNEATSGKTAFTVEDMPDGATWISLVVAQNVPTADPARPFVMCHSLTKDDCATSSEIFGTAILPVCGEVLENCIVGLKIFKSGEQVESAICQECGWFHLPN